MHDPCTQAFEIKWPFGGRVWNGHRFRPVIARIWHVDPEVGGQHGNRSDDSCGWHTPPTTPEQRERFRKIGEEEYCDIFGKRWATQNGKSYASVCFEPTCYDAVYWAWRRIKREHVNGVWKYGDKSLSSRELERIYHMASSPIDNYRVTVAGINSPEECGDFFVSIYRSYLRFNRPWWKHPKWHVWHWRLQVPAWQSLRRWLFTRCAHCGKRFGYGASPISHGWTNEKHGWFQSERGLYHKACSTVVWKQQQPRETQMGPATKATADRLVAAIKEYNKDGKHDKLMDRAAAGEFSDFGDTHACPITELHRLCRKYGLDELADRVANGEFDASKEESDEWAASASGQEIAKELSPAMREVIGLKLNH